MNDLETFVGISAECPSLAEMLRELALDPITISAVETEEKKHEEPPLVLSTIHSSKGLEWEHVFIIQCLDGIIPSAYSLEDEYQLDEELRLLYVATTRAKQMLYYSYPALAHSQYGDYFTKPSRFIDDLNEQILEPWLLSHEQNLPEEERDKYLTD